MVQKVINELTNLTDLNKKNEDEQKRGLEQQVLNDTVQILQKIVTLNISDSNIDILAPASNILDDRNTKSWRNMTVIMMWKNPALCFSSDPPIMCTFSFGLTHSHSWQFSMPFFTFERSLPSFF